MKLLAKFWSPVLVGAMLVGHLYAQPRTGDAPAQPGDAAPRVSVSPEEMKRQAQVHHAQLREAVQRIQAQRAKARKEQDVIKLTCVNDKFVRLKAQANIFDEAYRELLAVMDTDARDEAFERVSKSASEIRLILEEATVCVGEPQLSGSETGHTAPTLLDDPTLGLPFDIGVEAPAYASPYI